MRVGHWQYGGLRMSLPVLVNWRLHIQTSIEIVSQLTLAMVSGALLGACAAAGRLRGDVANLGADIYAPTAARFLLGIACKKNGGS